MERRQFVQMVAGAAVYGGAAVAGAEVVQAAAGAASADAKAVSDGEREAVEGIGGFFFRAEKPKELAAWYREHLGIGVTPTGAGEQPWMTDAGVVAFQPFSMTSGYFDKSKMWMMNFRVHRLDRMVAQLRAAGIEVTEDEKAYEYGRFAHLHDPEGNPIELWEPAPKR